MGIFADLFTDMMPTYVTVERILTRGYDGAPTYSPPVKYQARVNTVQRNILGADGQVVIARGRVWLDTVDPFTVNDRVTFADSSAAILLNVNQVSDETGPAYTSFDFQ